MKRFGYLSLCGAAALVAAFAISPAHAQSAKTVAGVRDLSVLSLTNGQAVNLMNVNLKTANQKDLLITVSAQCNLFTKTTVHNKSDGSADTASATAGLGVQVLVDGTPALPSHDGADTIDDNGNVVPGTQVNDFLTFCQRSQTLTATLGQGLVDCTVTAGAVGGANCSLTDQEISLLLSTLDAHSFTFIAPNVSAGNHSITVQGTLNDATTMGDAPGSAVAQAIFGQATVTVEEVRFVNGLNVDLN